ncbi:DUF4282 domain-containing protein [Pseudarthrobacter sp. PH31-O2]|uniref:DUF4282 domain-containing protein n=1 Tax=Micrococcaceae TaxID=1268 RepID=UPI0024B99DC4|nr:DUF4282 domain-containing protein [Pseudarthrobacter sp. PH31-O2]MDJ0354225.1 DUF4282 domain-containing protein [Pseudarthrobacter sp. PH31-O2]
MKNLFDLSFTRFISPSIAKIVYILIMIALGVMYLVFVIAAFSSRSPVLGLLVLLVIGPLFVIIYLALARIGLESLVAGIRTAENTAELVRLQGGTPAAGTHGGLPAWPNSPPVWNAPTSQSPGTQQYPAGYRTPEQPPGQ